MHGRRKLRKEWIFWEFGREGKNSAKSGFPKENISMVPKSDIFVTTKNVHFDLKYKQNHKTRHSQEGGGSNQLGKNPQKIDVILS